MRIKKTLRCLARIVLFLLLLVVVLRFTGKLLAGSVEDPLNHAGEGMYCQLPGMLDVVFVGASHVYSTVIPQLIYDETGITCYDFSSSAQSFESTYWAMVDALRCQHPKVVCVELSIITASDTQRQAPSYYTALARMLTPFSLTKCQAFFSLRAAEQQNLAQAENFFPESAGELDWTDYFRLTAFHTQWELSRDSFNFVTGNDFNAYSRGYCPRFSSGNIIEQEQDNEISALSEEMRDVLQRMIDTAARHNTQFGIHHFSVLCHPTGA